MMTLTGTVTSPGCSCRRGLSVMKRSIRHSGVARGLAWVGVLAVCVSSGCVVSPSSTERSLSRSGGTIGPARLTATEVQSMVMSFCDEYLSTITEVWNQIAREADTPDARLHAQGRLVGNASGAISIATAPNPVVGMCDMVAFVMLQRQTFEMPWVTDRFGPEAQAKLVTTYGALEADIWQKASTILTEEHQDQLRGMIKAWREENPDQTFTAFIRMNDLAAVRRNTLSDRKGSSSILTLVALDPLASAEPAVYEMQQSRLLAERVFYYTERAPFLLRGHVRGLAYEVSAMPETMSLIESADRASRASERLAAVAERLRTDTETTSEKLIADVAQHVAEERAMAVTQINETLDHQRMAFLEDLERAHEQTAPMLAETRATIGEATNLADAIREAALVLEPIVTTSKPDQHDASTRGMSASGETKPDTMVELRGFAQDAGVTVRDAAVLTREVATVLESSVWTDRQRDVESLIDRIFFRVLMIIIALPLSIVISIVIYHQMRRRDLPAATVKTS